MVDQLLQNHLDVLELRKQRAEEVKPGLMARAFAAVLGAVTTNTLYANRPRLYDVAKNYTPVVDWDGIIAEDPLFAGAYLKAFEPYDDTPTGDAACDNWFVDGWDQDLTALYLRKKLHGPYIFTNPARKSVLQSLEWYKSLDVGTKDQQFSKWLSGDPHIWGLLRIWKVGFQKILHPTLDDVIQMKSNDFDFVVWDDERYWKYYGVSPLNAPSNVIPDVVLGEVWGRTPQRAQKLIDWGVLPKRPQLNYSAVWVTEQYMKAQAAVLDNWDAICAGYFFSGTSVVTTLAEMASKYLTKIPDAWRPRLFGRSAKMMQISGDYFKVRQFKTATGGMSALDLNVFWDGWAGMKSYFPDSNLGDPGTVEPPVEPPAAETVTIATTISTVNMRKDASTSQKAIALLPVGTRLEVLETKTIGSDTWRRVQAADGGFWVADVVNGKNYLKITEEPKVR